MWEYGPEKVKKGGQNFEEERERKKKECSIRRKMGDDAEKQ